MTNSNGDRTLKIIIWGFGIVTTLSSVIWAISAQSTKLNAVSDKQKVISKKVDSHDIALTVIRTQLDYLIEGQKEIKGRLKNGH